MNNKEVFVAGDVDITACVAVGRKCISKSGVNAKLAELRAAAAAAAATVAVHGGMSQAFDVDSEDDESDEEFAPPENSYESMGKAQLEARTISNPNPNPNPNPNRNPNPNPNRNLGQKGRAYHGARRRRGEAVQEPGQARVQGAEGARRPRRPLALGVRGQLRLGDGELRGKHVLFGLGYG